MIGVNYGREDIVGIIIKNASSNNDPKLSHCYKDINRVSLFIMFMISIIISAINILTSKKGIEKEISFFAISLVSTIMVLYLVMKVLQFNIKQYNMLIDE